MRFLGKRVHAAGIDPAVVEIEERADRNSEVDRLVGPSQVAERNHVGGGNARRIVIHLVDEAEERLVLFVERRSFEIVQNAPDQVLISQQFRRNCGVRLQSKWTIVAVGSARGDQFAHARAEWRRSTENLLGKARQVVGGFRQEGEHVPDLRVLGAVVAH